MVLKNGARFGRYEIRGQLGRGGAGAVFRAYDAVLRRDVALKVLDDTAGGGLDSAVPRDHITRLVREARAAAAVSHPNAVAVFDVGEVDGVSYIAMELIDGKPLRASIGDAAVPISRRVRWLVDAARALAAAHARGVVHRDVKPENIMVRADGIAKVLDFGIARIGGGGTVPGTIVGTPLYMAPEQMRGDPIDARADQFAWGVVAYELLTGEPPWGHPRGGLRGIGEMMVKAPPPIDARRPEVPARIARAIERALSVLPGERFPSMAALVQELEPPTSATMQAAPEQPAADDTRPEGPPSVAPSERAPEPTAKESDALPGTLAGRYVPRRLIGRGAMGAVYEVEHAHTGERWALKVLHAHVANDDASIERFRREARVASQVRTDHLVRIIDADVAPELGGAPYMVMDLLEGRSLASIAGSAPQPAARVVGWLAQVASGLERAHARGIVHRDLKPANLFVARRLDGTCILKILDFGIAKGADRSEAHATIAGTVVGTPLYMSPEQAGQDPLAVTAASDIWSIGAVAFRLLAGREYWEDGSVARIIARILDGPIDPPSERGLALGDAFDAWFLRSCARDVRERWPSVSAQVRALADARGVDAEAAVRETQSPAALAPMVGPSDDGAHQSLGGAATSHATAAKVRVRRASGRIAALGVVAAVAAISIASARRASPPRVESPVTAASSDGTAVAPVISQKPPVPASAASASASVPPPPVPAAPPRPRVARPTASAGTPPTSDVKPGTPRHDPPTRKLDPLADPH